MPPLMFMGEEWGATTPFPFFCDFEGDLADAVRAGRRREFAEAYAKRSARTSPTRSLYPRSGPPFWRGPTQANTCHAMRSSRNYCEFAGTNSRRILPMQLSPRPNCVRAIAF